MLNTQRSQIKEEGNIIIMGHRMMILLFPALTLGHGDHPQINGYSLCAHYLYNSYYLPWIL